MPVVDVGVCRLKLLLFDSCGLLFVVVCVLGVCSLSFVVCWRCVLFVVAAIPLYCCLLKCEVVRCAWLSVVD